MNKSILHKSIAFVSLFLVKICTQDSISHFQKEDIGIEVSL
jgi:hypothetical protein